MTALVLIIMLTLGVLIAPFAIEAQQPPKVPRIGVLMPALNLERTRNLEAFRDALRDLGWVEGQNLAMEYRFAEHGLEQFSELAADLVRLKVDVLVVGGGAPAVHAAKEATSTIPIVMVSGGGAIEAGLIDSLTQPGGNITGTVSVQTDLIARRLELLKEAVPGVSRLAVLVTPRQRGGAGLQETQHAAQAMGVTLHVQGSTQPRRVPERLCGHASGGH
jgi:putative ABC transport system substrate-binding protein